MYHFLYQTKTTNIQYKSTKKNIMTVTTANFKDLLPLLHTYNGHSLPPKPNKIVHPWKPEEDELLLQAVEEFGIKRWHLVAQRIPNRSRKQCRERYCNHLDPEIVKIPWSSQEDEILKQAKLEFGNKWTLIKQRLPGRTANQVKNRYFSKFSDLEKKISQNEISSSFAFLNSINHSVETNKNEMKEMEIEQNEEKKECEMKLVKRNETKCERKVDRKIDRKGDKKSKQPKRKNLIEMKEKKDLSAFVPVDQKLFVVSLGGSLYD